MRTNQCKTCVHYENEGTGVGACHRFPPVFVGSKYEQDPLAWSFPLVLDEDGCGEYTAKHDDLHLLLEGDSNS